MAVNLIYPTAQALNRIAQDYIPDLTQDDPIFQLFPIRDVDEYFLAWEQRDNWVGLQAARGVNGEPPRVQRVAERRYQCEPGVYGEFSLIDEAEILQRRPEGQYTGAINLSELIIISENQLMGRMYDRIRQIGWLAAQGTFAIGGPNGAVIHTDTFPVRTFSATVTWGTYATATPLADLRTVNIFGRGTSSTFDQSARAYATKITINKMLSNTNPADIYGRRTAGLSTLNTLDQQNQLYMGEGLPALVQYDRGYYDESNTFRTFIPDNKIIVVGTRPNNVPIGEYRMTRNASNPDLSPGYSNRVIDNVQTAGVRQIQVHCGHNGGPVIYFPSAVVVMNV